MSSSTGSGWTSQEIVEIAGCQRFVIRVIGVQILAICLFVAALIGSSSGSMRAVNDLVALVSGVALIGGGVFGMLGVYRMAKSLRRSEAMLYVLLAFLIPLAGLLILLMLSTEATRVMQENGVQVGVMGANPEDIERLKSEVGAAA